MFYSVFVVFASYILYCSFFASCALCSLYLFLFLCPGLKGPPGASSVWIVHLSVCLSVSVPLTNKVQYLKFGSSYSNQTWTVSSSMGSPHFTDITSPLWWGGRGQNVGLRYFCHILTLLPPGASVFHKHMSCLYLYLVSSIITLSLSLSLPLKSRLYGAVDLSVLRQGLQPKDHLRL